MDAEACSLLNSEPFSVKEIEESLIDQISEESPVGKKRGRKGKANTPVVDSKVRRSLRVKANAKGFKVNSCRIKNCLGCSNDSPTLSPATLKKLGSSMCQLQEEDLDDFALMEKNKLEPVGKKVKKTKDCKGKSPEKEDDEKGTDDE